MRRLLAILLSLILASGLIGCRVTIVDEEESAPSDAVSFELVPSMADLSLAPDVVIEPEESPYNIGGWKADNTVTWGIQNPTAGEYQLVVNYSRSNKYDEDSGRIDIKTEDGRTEEMYFDVIATGSEGDADDWSVYIDSDAYTIELPEGTVMISITPDLGMDSEYFINLRSIKLTNINTSDESANLTIDKNLSDLVGTWYKNGNTKDEKMQINEDSTWALTKNEDNEDVIIVDGNLVYDEGQIGFTENESKVTYYSDPTNDGSLMYIGHCFFLEDYSVDGFGEYDGQWYLENDENQNYLEISKGKWMFYESTGTMATSNLRGYLASDGQEDLRAYDSNDMLYARIGLVNDNMLNFKGLDYYLI